MLRPSAYGKCDLRGAQRPGVPGFSRITATVEARVPCEFHPCSGFPAQEHVSGQKCTKTQILIYITLFIHMSYSRHIHIGLA